MEVNKKFDLATTVVGNLFSRGILGVIVDLAGGAEYSQEPADIQANMTSLEAAGVIPVNFESAKDDIFVFMLTTEEWEAIQPE